MYRLLRALLFLLPPELAHSVGMLSLRVLGLVARFARPNLPDLESTVAGLRDRKSVV